MLKYTLSNATGKQGVNFIKKIVKTQGHGFIEIHNEDDIGLDCLVQLNKDNIANRIISMQVKSGNSFYNPGHQTCKIPIDKHSEYWQSKEFPVLGIVFVPNLFKAFWCDLKLELPINKNSKQITFPATPDNEFNNRNLIKYVENIGFPTYFYVARIRENSDERTKIILNTITPNISKLVPSIIRYLGLKEMITINNWKFITKKEQEDIKKRHNLVFTNIGTGNGIFMYNTQLKIMYFDEKFQMYFDEKLKKLSETLTKHE